MAFSRWNIHGVDAGTNYVIANCFRIQTKFRNLAPVPIYARGCFKLANVSDYSKTAITVRIRHEDVGAEATHLKRYKTVLI